MRVLEEERWYALHCLNNRHYTLTEYFSLLSRAECDSTNKVHHAAAMDAVWRLPAGNSFTRHLISSFLCLSCCRPLYLSLCLPLLQSTWSVLYLLRKNRLNLNKARLHGRRMLFIRWIFLDNQMKSNYMKLHKTISDNVFYGSGHFMVNKW